MVLNYDLTKINGGDFRQVTHRPVRDEHGSPLMGDDGVPLLELSPVTDALIYYTVSIGMGTITRRNQTEFYRRATLVGRTLEPFVVAPLARYDRTLWRRDQDGEHLLATMESDDGYIAAMREHVADVYGVVDTEQWRATEEEITTHLAWNRTGDFNTVIDVRPGAPTYVARRTRSIMESAPLSMEVTLDDVRAHIGLVTNATVKRRAAFDAWLLARLASANESAL